MSDKNWEEELSDPAKWSTDDEVFLLFCTLDNKPVGIDKHLQMSIIWSRFRELTRKNVSSDVLWKKLESWYNLKHLDDVEPLVFKNNEEDFLLPSEIIPEYYTKFLSDEEKKNIDFSGQYKKYISVCEPDEEDEECKVKLKGSERMKWFECPTSETKPLRKYGKAGDITSGTILTISVPPQLLDELDDNTGDDDNKEDGTKRQISTDTKTDSEKSRKRKRGSTKKGETSDDNDSPASKQGRRFSRRVSSTSESKPETPKSEPTPNKNTEKRKSMARR